CFYPPGQLQEAPGHQVERTPLDGVGDVGTAETKGRSHRHYGLPLLIPEVQEGGDALGDEVRAAEAPRHLFVATEPLRTTTTRDESSFLPSDDGEPASFSLVIHFCTALVHRNHERPQQTERLPGRVAAREPAIAHADPDESPLHCHARERDRRPETAVVGRD